MNQAGTISKKDVFNFGKLFALLGIVLVSIVTLTPNRANAITIEVPFSWFYTFDGQCILGCNTNDSFGNPIASFGADFDLYLQNGITGIPHEWMGYDLTDPSAFTFLDAPSYIDESFVTSSGNQFRSNGAIRPGDTIIDAPGLRGEAAATAIPVNELGNVTGVYSNDSGFLAGPNTADIDFLTITGFPTVFSVVYNEVFEVDQSVPVSDRNTNFYTDDGRPFWIGLGDWSREIANSITTEIHEPVAVPEPTTMGLMGLGLMGMVATRRKKQKQA